MKLFLMDVQSYQLMKPIRYNFVFLNDPLFFGKVIGYIIKDALLSLQKVVRVVDAM